MRIRKETPINFGQKLKTVLILGYYLQKAEHNKGFKIVRQFLDAKSKGTKALAIAKLFSKFLPDSFLKNVFDLEEDFSRLPEQLFSNIENIEFYRAGFEHLVYIVCFKNGAKKLLKIDYVSKVLEKDSNSVYHDTANINREHMLVISSFEDIPFVIIPETYYFVGSNPMGETKKFTKLCLVEFIDSEEPFIDVMSEVDRGRLLNVFCKYPEFKESFNVFLEKLEQFYDKEYILDIFGSQNVVVAIIGGRPKICLLDCSKSMDNQKYAERFKMKIASLKRFLD